MSDLDDMKIVPMGDEALTSMDVNEAQVQVRFVRSKSAPNLPLAPETPFSVPVKLARLGLSELLNHIIEDGSTRPYEFLINNRFLRTSLEKFLKNHGLSGEAELELEYIEAMPPPDRDTSTPHPDWISSVDACLGVTDAMLPVPTEKKKKRKDKEDEVTYSKQTAVLAATGCYDHLVRVWGHTAPRPYSAEETAVSAKGTCSLVAQGAGHLGPVTDVRVARPWSKTSTQENPALIVSASHDRSLRMWSFVPGAASEETTTTVPPPAKLTCKGVFDYHVGTVQCVETLFHPNRPGSLADPTLNSAEIAGGCVRFVSGGYDGAIALWINHSDFAIDPEEVAAKRELQYKGMGRKLKAQKTRALQAAAKTELTTEEQLTHYRPISALLGHRGAVSSLCWAHLNHIYSGSHDYTIKHWDLSSSTAVHSWSSGHVVNDIDFSEGMNLIASADQDGYVRFYDPRIGDGQITTSTKGSLKACATWVSEVRWAPSILGAPHLLATASYDGMVKFWDIRSSKPLHTMDTSSERLLTVDWVPAVAPQQGMPAQTYALVGGTGKTLDRVSWKVYV